MSVPGAHADVRVCLTVFLRSPCQFGHTLCVSWDPVLWESLPFGVDVDVVHVNVAFEWFRTRSWIFWLHSCASVHTYQRPNSETFSSNFVWELYSGGSGFLLLGYVAEIVVCCNARTVGFLPFLLCSSVYGCTLNTDELLLFRFQCSLLVPTPYIRTRCISLQMCERLRWSCKFRTIQSFRFVLVCSLIYFWHLLVGRTKR